MEFFQTISVTIDNFLLPFSKIMIFKTPLNEYIIFAFSFILFFVLFTFSKKYILAKMKKHAQRNGTPPDYTFINTIKNIKLIFHITTAIFISTKIAVLNVALEKFIDSLFIITLIYQIILLTQNLGIYFIRKFWHNPEDEEENANAVNGLSLILKIIIWTIGFLLIMTNLGFKISALVASLGVTSIAVAFALQSILADIFSSFSIYLDTPFRVNDFIIVGNDMGTVKKIGIKTTRIQALGGEELVISNYELTRSRIRNFKLMEKRRIIFHLNIKYGTAHDKLNRIPEIVKGIITNTLHTELDRVHFKEFGDFSLIFEAVYYITSNDYNIFMDAQQKINLEIVKAFETEGIEFAFPTQTIHMFQDEIQS